MEGSVPPPRPPEPQDLTTLCRSFNDASVRYIVIGGTALNYHGFLRATEDIDFLVERSDENIRSLRKALEILPDKAIREATDDDFKNPVLRIADEIVVDIMFSACGVAYEEARGEVTPVEIDGVLIPFASPELLLRLKRTHREKDQLDCMYLERLIAQRSEKKQ